MEAKTVLTKVVMILLGLAVGKAIADRVIT